jgi:hypothetical protein
MTTAWKERASRGLALGSMNQYETVADALFEIIDNPVDYRLGRKLTINVAVQKPQDLVVIEDIGGEGMDDEGIQDWLNWGSGHPHLSHDIGRYHYGGKAATGFLANHIRIMARRANTTTVWLFEDREWATRQEWADYGEPKTAQPRQIPIHLSWVQPTEGFVRVELRDLHKSRRYNLEDLRFRLANVYRVLLSKGDITITLNDLAVVPLALPRSTAFQPVHLNETLPSGRRLRGQIWRLNRDDVLNSRFIKGGIRTLFNGRLITEGEYFGYYAEGKGLLASLIGEIHLDWCTPVPTKTAWIKDCEEWYEVDETMRGLLQPIIKAFREAAEKNPVPREERKRASEVHRQLNQVLKLLARGDGQAGGAEDETKSLVVAEAGRRASQPCNGGAEPNESENESAERTRAPTRNPTPPPTDAVGKLRRLVERLDRAGGFPPIRLKPLDRALRSGRDVENGSEVIAINVLHPMYREMDGGPSYIAETAILEMLRPNSDSDSLRASEYYGQALQMLNAWYKVAERES